MWTTAWSTRKSQRDFRAGAESRSTILSSSPEPTAGMALC